MNIDKNSSISESEFFNIVGETFKFDPDFFMKELYKTFRNKMSIGIGAEKLKEMEKYIIKKFCLLEEEQILYECKGIVKQTELLKQTKSGKYKRDSSPVKISVSSGNIFLTNYRIIAQGKLKVSGGENSFLWFWAPSLSDFTGFSRRAERKKAIIESSPLFGYQFPIKNHTGLGKINLLHIVVFSVKIENRKCTISIKPSNSLKREEHMSKIFDILRKDASEVINVINEANETEIGKDKQRSILSILKGLRKSEEFQQLSNSDYFDIVTATYKLNPSFFLSSIYPKMVSWDYSSYLTVKEEVITLIDKLSKEFVLSKPELDDNSIKFVKE